MDEQLRQIGERLRGLRDALDLSAQEVADVCGIALEKYERIEKGEVDITISNLMKIARKYGVNAEELMFAEMPHMRSYSVTRKGQGLSVERTKAYKYQSLVSGFVGHKADVFIVTVEPKPEATKFYKNTHPGQEFNMVLEGSMELYIAGKTITLDEGDSIYFDSTKPHGMKALGDKAVRFLAFTVE
ncbi:MAG: cupin domain-containing protein [Prevotella sp.]|nr:cupin domain-containing protein [Prevotella sp.]